jgi:hypothetical protein
MRGQSSTGRICLRTTIIPATAALRIAARNSGSQSVYAGVSSPVAVWYSSYRHLNVDLREKGSNTRRAGDSKEN